MISQAMVLFTDRKILADAWHKACATAGLSIEVANVADIATRVAPGAFVAFDGGAQSGDEDELLAAMSFARAMRAYPMLLVDPSRLPMDAGLMHELTGGLIATADQDMLRLVQVLARRMDGSRAARFEYITVSPRSDEILVLLGDGRSALLQRPVSATDDGTEIVDIALGEDPSTATLALSSGKKIELRADQVPAIPTTTENGIGAPIPVDGVQLGARLRSLRVAAGLTQAELARRTGIHRPNIARVEAGRHTPSLETLARLASAIGVPTTRIFAHD